MRTKYANQKVTYYKMKHAEVYIKKCSTGYYYFYMYDAPGIKGSTKKWMSINFMPDLDSYDIIDKEPVQVPIPDVHYIPF